MLSVSFTDHHLAGDEIASLLARKNQYWDQLKSSGSIYALASHSQFGVIFEDDNPLVYIFEMPGEPGVLHLLLVKERNRADQRKEELAAIGRELASRWRGFRRVEAKVADSFVQTHRILRRMGFYQETGPKGLRAFFTDGGKPVPVHVFSMLPEEVIAKYDNVKMSAEVGHGVE